MLVDTNGKKIHITIGNRGVDKRDARRILDYLQGAVYCWCKNRKDEEFSVQKLFGDENNDWTGTPIEELYKNRLSSGTADPVDEAGKDCGHLLRRTLQEDKNRKFMQTDTKFPGQHYKWIPN